jgi:hypothetical protein
MHAQALLKHAMPIRTLLWNRKGEDGAVKDGRRRRWRRRCRQRGRPERDSGVNESGERSGDGRVGHGPGQTCADDRKAERDGEKCRLQACRHDDEVAEPRLTAILFR